MSSITHLDQFASALTRRITGYSSLSAPCGLDETTFNDLALELFSRQFQRNQPFRALCKSRWLEPSALKTWEEIPAIPTVAFKELELSCLAPVDRTAMFHSSGTSEQRPSRHFHNSDSLQLYEASLLAWFQPHFLPDSAQLRAPLRFLFLTPPASEVPHSSLVHMFETIRRAWGAPDSHFVGRVAADQSWHLDLDECLSVLQASAANNQPLAILGTAFSFVHLLDHMTGQSLWLQLPAGSRALETGGYKGRSRVLPKAELHSLISERLGVPPQNLVCEYGMSELSSQAYDRVAGLGCQASRVFHFPPWARARVVSPETGREAAEGENGLLRILDLANVYSVLAIQTEDLAVRRGDRFELLGRAAEAEPRGCSLMATA